MAKLTPKQEKFAQCVADGMTQADAYRAAYDVGINTKPETVWRKASELMNDGKVEARVLELKDKLEKKTLWTREMSVKALITAYKDGKPSEKIQAVKELNLMHGYNAPSKHEITGAEGKPIEQVVVFRLPDNGRGK